MPTITIFKDTPGQEIDVEANTRHVLYLAQAGIHGVLIQGSTGEQVSLTREERVLVRYGIHDESMVEDIVFSLLVPFGTLSNNTDSTALRSSQAQVHKARKKPSRSAKTQQRQVLTTRVSFPPVSSPPT